MYLTLHSMAIYNSQKVETVWLINKENVLCLYSRILFDCLKNETPTFALKADEPLSPIPKQWANRGVVLVFLSGGRAIPALSLLAVVLGRTTGPYTLPGHQNSAGSGTGEAGEPAPEQSEEEPAPFTHLL